MMENFTPDQIQTLVKIAVLALCVVVFIASVLWNEHDMRKGKQS